MKQISPRLRKFLSQNKVQDKISKHLNPSPFLRPRFGIPVPKDWLEQKYASGLQWAADNPEDAQDLVVTFLASGPVDKVLRVWIADALADPADSVRLARQTDKALRHWVVPSPSVGRKELSPSMLLELKQALEAARNGTMPVWLGPLYKDATHGRALLAKLGQSPVQHTQGLMGAAMEVQRKAIGALIESGAWADSFRARLSGKWIAPDKSIGRKGRHQPVGKQARKAGKQSPHVRARQHGRLLWAHDTQVRAGIA